VGSVMSLAGWLVLVSTAFFVVAIFMKGDL
jgi:hypothetical protein